MQTISSDILQQLQRPDAASHKGQNGRILIIAGSQKFHGALLLAVQAASRIVDMVYVYTSENNRSLIEALKSDVATFIPVLKSEVDETVNIVDAVLVGPGLDEGDECLAFVHSLLETHQDKKIIVDATALWYVNKELLHKKCIITPHSREFLHVFGLSPGPNEVTQAAQEAGCTVVLKGKTDYISDGTDVWENTTGNVGMTKGGTGDVLAGVITAFAATNTPLLAAQAGAYLSGLAGDRLLEQVGTFYNDEDVVGSMGEIWKEYLS